MEHEAQAAQDPVWASETRRTLRRQRAGLTVANLASQFTAPLVLLVLLWPALDRLAVQAGPFAFGGLGGWVLDITGNLARADAPMFDPATWLAAAGLWLTWRSLRARQADRAGLALAATWGALLPTWGFFRVSGLAEPMSPVWALVAAGLLAWIGWTGHQARRRTA